MKNSIGGNGTIARLGGDEFVIVLPHIESTDKVVEIVENIYNMMQKPWLINGNTLKVTTSMGIAIVSDKNITSAPILKTADKALYEAKNAGENSYKIIE